MTRRRVLPAVAGCATFGRERSRCAKTRGCSTGSASSVRSPPRPSATASWSMRPSFWRTLHARRRRAKNDRTQIVRTRTCSGSAGHRSHGSLHRPGRRRDGVRQGRSADWERHRDTGVRRLRLRPSSEQRGPRCLAVRQPCPASTPAVRLVTKVCATRLTRRLSRRSSPPSTQDAPR
jgi:hypothetical protein